MSDDKAKRGTMQYMADLMKITCIMQRGKADIIVDAAIEAGAPAATIVFGRGTGIRQRMGLLKIAINPEKEVIEVVVPSEQADGIFDAMVKAGKMDIPGMGVIYMTSIARALIYQPEKIEQV